MLNVKVADDPEVALQALWPRLHAFAVIPYPPTIRKVNPADTPIPPDTKIALPL
jgi:hypothetical protein